MALGHLLVEEAERCPPFDGFQGSAPIPFGAARLENRIARPGGGRCEANGLGRVFVRGRQDEAAGKFQLEFVNTGDVGAAFLVYTAGSPDAPRTYTVEAGKRLSDKLAVNAGGAYDFTVHGPNGFLRRFAGKLALSGLLRPHGHALEVKEGYDVANGNLQLRLINHGRAPTVFGVAVTSRPRIGFSSLIAL